ncbi:MAG: damage-control phosphatase ARMT1 family protein, partial [Thermodesulfobacteriota bacterium]
ITGRDDPYREIKDFYNRFALDMYTDLKQRVRQSGAPFETAVRLAIAGNIIDFGVSTDLDVSTVRNTIEDSLSGPVFGDLESLAAAAVKAKSIVYLGDNAGEILFDRILIEEIGPDKVIFVTRGGPVINDVTVQDAEAVGLTNCARVMDNGTDVPGTVLSECSEAFIREFERADLVISKGQGNYETLSDTGTGGKLFFLFKVKCPVVAQDIGCEMGRAVAASNKNGNKWRDE